MYKAHQMGAKDYNYIGVFIEIQMNYAYKM